METSTAQSQSTFGNLFNSLFAGATTILTEVGKVKAQGYVQNLEAKNFVKVQETLAKNAASPSNDKKDALTAAAENTVNLFGFLNVPKEHAPFYTIAFFGILALSLVVVIRLIRK